MANGIPTPLYTIFSLMWTRTDVGQPFVYNFLTNVTARSYDWA
jgi:uncharacterized protein YycO